MDDPTQDNGDVLIRLRALRDNLSRGGDVYYCLDEAIIHIHYLRNKIEELEDELEDDDNDYNMKPQIGLAILAVICLIGLGMPLIAGLWSTITGH